MDTPTIVQITIEDIPLEYHDDLFEMYKNTYSNAGQDLWFKTKTELLSRYPCLLCYDGNYKKLYVLYQFKKGFNKISLVCHDGTPTQKQNSIQIRKDLVNTPGWMLEASGATSWILRKGHAPMISNESDIKNALDINDENENDKIEMNVGFDVNDKNSYQYTRVFKTLTGEIYRTNETLFGISPCRYVTTSCDRKCEPIQSPRSTPIKMTRSTPRKMTRSSPSIKMTRSTPRKMTRSTPRKMTRSSPSRKMTRSTPRKMTRSTPRKMTRRYGISNENP